MTRYLGKPLVLIVEDYKENRVVSETDRKQTQPLCDYVIKNTGEDVLLFLETHYKPPNLILLDDALPSRNGLDLVYELRQSIWKAIPILLFASDSSPQNVNKAYDRGVNAFIKKINPDQAIIDSWRTMDTFWLNYVTLPDV